MVTPMPGIFWATEGTSHLTSYPWTSKSPTSVHAASWRADRQSRAAAIAFKAAVEDV